MTSPTNLSSKFCALLIESEYKIYNSHYQNFQKFGQKKQNFLNWKQYLIKQMKNNKADNLQACLLLSPTNELTRLEGNYNIDSDFYYCGHFSRAPQNEVENQIKLTIIEMVKNVEFGSDIAAWLLLKENNYKSTIRLNKDLEYYLRKILQNDELTSARDKDLSELAPLFDKKKLDFLDDAVSKRDFGLVLEATNKCNY